MIQPANAPKVRPQKTHVLKSWPADFEAIRIGELTAEIRRCDDRDFRVGDILEEREYEPTAARFTGRMIRLRITRVDRMVGPRMLAGIGRSSLDDVVPLAFLSFGRIST